MSADVQVSEAPHESGGGGAPRVPVRISIPSRMLTGPEDPARSGKPVVIPVPVVGVYYVRYKDLGLIKALVQSDVVSLFLMDKDVAVVSLCRRGVYSKFWRKRPIFKEDSILTRATQPEEGFTFQLSRTGARQILVSVDGHDILLDMQATPATPLRDPRHFENVETAKAALPESSIKDYTPDRELNRLITLLCSTPYFMSWHAALYELIEAKAVTREREVAVGSTLLTHTRSRMVVIHPRLMHVLFPRAKDHPMLAYHFQLAAVHSPGEISTATYGALISQIALPAPFFS